MKRLLVVFALVIFMCSAASAEGMMFGVKGGLNLANVMGEDTGGSEMKMLFGGGIFMNYAFSEEMSLQPEVLFMMKGTGIEGLDDSGFKFSYIDIPVLFKYAMPTDSGFVPALFFGPYISMLMSAKAELLGVEVDIKDETKSLDFGLVIGAGFDYAMGEGAFTLDVRYALGLTTTMDIEGVDEQPDMKNVGIMFLLGYGFAF